MFRNNRAARIILPLIIIAIMVAVMEFIDFQKKEKDVIIGSCSVEIDCKTVLKNMDDLKAELKKDIPKDGVVLKKMKVDLHEGDTAYDVLYRATKAKNISLESSGPKNDKYVEGINNLYEKDCGPQSGWLYFVNGKKPGKSSSTYKLKRNDVVAWKFTCKEGDIK